MISIHPRVVYRVPCFPINATLNECWPELKRAIAGSSPEFYNLIEHLTIEDLPDVSSKVKNTIWKYFNRARFRATPYGRFAGIGTFDFKKDKGATLKISDRQIFHEFIDWQYANNPSTNFSIEQNPDVELLVNATCYWVNNAIRFISKSADGFVLSEIEGDKLIMDILDQCSNKKKLSDFNAAPEHLSLIEYLVNNQLLITSNATNIIGEDFFKRTNNTVGRPISTKYVIAERPLISGSLDYSLIKHLPEAISLLNSLNHKAENSTLKEFARRFTQKFEQNEVSIMLALDPEVGIGYDDLELSFGEDSFILELSNNIQSKNTQAGQSLSKLLTSSIMNTSVWALSVDLQSLPFEVEAKHSSLPNTLSALCYSSGENLVVESLGGATANALLGRFSLASNEVHSLCKELSEIEQTSNPGTIFFDIAYQHEGRVDNVNRRRCIYDFQISILDYDTTQEPIQLSDVLLSVRNGEVYLRSKSTGQRMIPRMSSAYNTVRSDLSLFRLLSDLQHQNVNSALSFSIQNLIPDLAYYPRVTFKNIVLSPRKWQLKYHSKNNDTDNTLEAITNSGCRFIKYGNADQTICYDLKCDHDKELLIEIIRKRKSIYVEEMLISEVGNMTDLNGHYYQGQFLFSLYHKEALYKQMDKIKPLLERGNIIKSFGPGAGWLYYQIFIHPFQTDELLLNEISQLLNKFITSIDRFFFIRYNEGGEHIRLRLKLSVPSAMYKIAKTMEAYLKVKISSGVISELRLCTYQREGERYGWMRIDDVEEFFYKDSKATLSFLSTNPSPELKYQYTLSLINGVAQSDLFSEDEFLSIIKSVSNNFNNEHQFGPFQFALLNEKYRCEITMNFTDEIRNHMPLTALVEALKRLLKNCSDKQERQKLFIDLIHMHVNRLFPTKQRMFEAVTYYFAHKHLLKQKAMKTTNTITG